MKKSIFKIMITALSMVLIIAAMPFAASAEAVALGEESPFISARFYDDATRTNEVDGNELAAGETYTVDLVVSDLSTMAVFNMTANFTSDITITGVTSLADVENSGFAYGGYKIDTDNNAFVIVFTTVNKTSYTELSGDTVVATLTVEVSTDGDFADFFDLSTDRNHTFIIANYEDGNEAAYVYKDLEQTSTDFPFLDYDMSPSSTFTVTGAVKVSKDELGDTYANDSKVAGATINVLDANGDSVATTTTDADGKFSIEVPENGVSLTITKTDSVILRTITLSGNADDSYPIIPVIAVDYDNSGAFGQGDKNKFNEDNEDADLDGSGAFGQGDSNIFNYFMTPGLSPSYNDFTL